MYKNLLVVATAGLLLVGCGESKDTSDTPVSDKSSEQANPTAAPETASSSTSSMSEDEKRAYALGANSAGFLARSFPEFDSWGMSIDREVVKRGFNDMLENKAALSTEEMQSILLNLQQEIQAKVAEIEQRQIAESTAANQAFLEANAAKEGVQVTESGLQYRIIKQGEGANPTADDVIRVHYKGTLIDGTVFDSSYDRGTPIDFPLGRVIQGWVEGIQLVKEGGIIELVMGPELAYGNQATETIPANSALVFEVELLKINPEPETNEETDSDS